MSALPICDELRLAHEEGAGELSVKTAALIEELALALERAEPLVETLHSITQAKDARAIVFRNLTAIRSALAKARGEA